jgi:hypothetical protein
MERYFGRRRVGKIKSNTQDAARTSSKPPDTRRPLSKASQARRANAQSKETASNARAFIPRSYQMAISDPPRRNKTGRRDHRNDLPARGHRFGIRFSVRRPEVSLSGDREKRTIFSEGLKNSMRS